MGNEDEIKKDITAPHTAFLPEEIQDLEGQVAVYSLEEEYARSKKNKNYKLYLFIFGFVVFVVGGVLVYRLVQDWLDKRNATVDIKDFEDLRLKEAMDSVRKRGSNIDTLRIGLLITEVEMLDEMLKVQKEYYKKETDILAQNLPAEETDRRVAQNRDEESVRLKKVRANFQALINRKKYEINSLQEAREKEDRKLASEGADTRVSNADRLYTLQMKQLKEKQQTGVDALKKYFDANLNFVTLKYNPLLTAQPVAGIISAGAGSGLANAGAMKEYDPVLTETGFGSDEFKGLRGKIANFGILMKRLIRIPYKNSIPPALKALDGLAGSIVGDYENLWTLLAQTLNKKNQIIEAKNNFIKRYEYPFDFVLNAKKENGLVVDPRDPNNILIHMNKSIKIEDGRTASVFNGTTLVGKIRISRDQSGALKGAVISMASKKATIQPTNRIMLDPVK